MEEDNLNNAKTLPDIQNYRNVLFVQWQELNNIFGEIQVPINKSHLKENLKLFRRKYIVFFGEINHSNKLNHLITKEVQLLKLYYNDPFKIGRTQAKQITEITRKLMEEYGVFDIERFGGSDELW